jgi:hypothetical protein
MPTTMNKPSFEESIDRLMDVVPSIPDGKIHELHQIAGVLAARFKSNRQRSITNSDWLALEVRDQGDAITGLAVVYSGLRGLRKGNWKTIQQSPSAEFTIDHEGVEFDSRRGMTIGVYTGMVHVLRDLGATTLPDSKYGTNDFTDTWLTGDVVQKVKDIPTSQSRLKQFNIILAPAADVITSGQEVEVRNNWYHVEVDNSDRLFRPAIVIPLAPQA